MSINFTMIPRGALLCGMVGVLLALTPVAAQAQSVSKRLEIIEKQLKAVQRKVFQPGSQFPRDAAGPEGAAQTPPSAGGNVRFANMEDRISQIETQLRQLTGRIEESNFQVSQMQQKMETMARDYEFRFAELEKGGVASVAPTQAPTATQQAPVAQGAGEILPGGSQQDQYSYAQNLVSKGQYAEAEVALAEFLKRYPKADLAGNAQYWLGQTYYVRKMYTKATRAFLEGYNNYPKSRKAPAFLLKIGMSLNAMGEKTDACDAYRELASRFPDSLENKNQRLAQEQRAGCR